ncbi:MAG: ribosome maturation factor RimP [Deltaproteobacteria bacterium]|nr:ribosome maturation factor RimP [Deltaproteobacteria bacterium]
MISDSGIVGKIRQLAEGVCHDCGVDLFDVEYVPGRGTSMLRVFIDDEVGINVEDCATVSRELSALLDVEDPIRGRYRLEVSSPGIDRPIRHSDDARKLIGKLVKVKTRTAVEGRKAFTGRLTDVRGETWVVQMEGRDWEIDARDVDRANMIFEFDR